MQLLLSLVVSQLLRNWKMPWRKCKKNINIDINIQVENRSADSSKDHWLSYSDLVFPDGQFCTNINTFYRISTLRDFSPTKVFTLPQFVLPDPKNGRALRSRSKYIAPSPVLPSPTPESERPKGGPNLQPAHDLHLSPPSDPISGSPTSFSAQSPRCALGWASGGVGRR